MARNSDKSENFTRRLAETMDTETDSEFYTPMSAGNEELPEYEPTFPLVKNLRQTNMNAKGGRPRSTSGRGKDAD